MSRPRPIALLLAAVTFALFLPVAWSGFCVYDDGPYVAENSFVQNGVTWAGVQWAFTTFYASNWHPLTWLSHMMDCGIFGLNPAGPHLVNALIHAANAALLFTLLWRLTNKLWPAAFIAGLFAWHPMHVESVAWIAERKDVLSTFFALLALLNYARYVEASKAQSPKSKVYFAWSLVTFALGLMAKPMLVTLPCVLLLLDFWPFGRAAHGPVKLFLEKWPFFLMTAAASVLTFLAQSQRGGNAVASLSIVPLHYRLKSVPLAYAEYLSKIFWPGKLAIFYPLHQSLPTIAVAAAVAALLAISLAAWQLRRPAPYLLTGWLWFIGMLVPVSGLVQVGSAVIADRYTYLPAVGLFIAVTLAACDLAARCHLAKSLLAGMAVFILAANVVAMERQLAHWRTNVTLFQHALAVTTDNDIDRNNLGVGLEQAGRLAEAAEQYRAATRLEPDRFEGFHNLAGALDQLGHPAEALAAHRTAVRISPATPFLHYALGAALFRAGKDEAALKEFSVAEKLDPHYAWPHLETAKLFLAQGRDTSAVAELRAALRAEPDNYQILAAAAHYLAANENAAARDGRAALVLAAKANVLAGGNQPMVFDVFGMACAAVGDFTNAQTCVESALTLARAARMKGLEPLQQRLELYRHHQPWRESFRATNAPAKN